MPKEFSVHQEISWGKIELAQANRLCVHRPPKTRSETGRVTLRKLLEGGQFRHVLPPAGPGKIYSVDRLISRNYKTPIS